VHTKLMFKYDNSFMIHVWKQLASVRFKKYFSIPITGNTLRKFWTNITRTRLYMAIYYMYRACAIYRYVLIMCVIRVRAVSGIDQTRQLLYFCHILTTNTSTYINISCILFSIICVYILTTWHNERKPSPWISIIEIDMGVTIIIYLQTTTFYNSSSFF